MRGVVMREASGTRSVSSAGARARVFPQEGFPCDVTDAGIDRNAQGAAFAQALDGLQVGETHEDDVAGLEIAERKSEEIVAFALRQGGAPAAGFGLLEELERFAALFGFGDDDTAVDPHFTAVDGRVGRQGEEVAAIEGLRVVLLEELIDFDIGKTGGDVGTNAETAQGENDAGFFQPGFEAEGFGGDLSGFHREVTFCFWRMRLIAVTWAAVGRAPSRPIKAKEPASGVTFQVSAENEGMVATGCCSRLARVRSSPRLASLRP